MNKPDYNRLMRQTIDNLSARFPDRKPRLLLHCCCAPCSSHCLRILHDFFDITVYFYNPNIDEAEEYEKRKQELIRFISRTGWATFTDCDYDAEAFRTVAQGLEDAPERGARCYLCYNLRIDRTAQAAKENGYDFFATTLTLSPLKNTEWLNTLGKKAQEKYGVEWLYSDFKKENGYLDSIRLSEEYELYRQNFCGCSYSKRK